MMGCTVLLFLLVGTGIGLGLASAFLEHDTPAKFKAAVYEHDVILPDTRTVVSRATALANMKKNLDIFEVKAAEARRQGAQIIVFPEDGVYGYKFKRDTIYPYLEVIPDPRLVTWSPCDDPDRYPDTEVQKRLSCMAKMNSIYIVADIGDKHPCNSSDPHCPPDHRYQYNTAVAFGPDGRLLARYHKSNLFFEYQFDTPDPEVIYFDTPFGRFGLMICFDILFYAPGVPMLVDNYNITNVAFPTAWMDALPMLSAIGFHSSFARGLGVNLLSANLHIPKFRFQGSGIFSPDGMEAFYYNNTDKSPGKLLVAELDVLNERVRGPRTAPNFIHDPNDIRSGMAVHQNPGELLQGNPANAFLARVSSDNFTVVPLIQESDSLKVCQKNVCCSLDYTMRKVANSQDRFAFGAYDGFHQGAGHYYLQVCALVKCKPTFKLTECRGPVFTSQTSFSRLEVDGSFDAEFVYPQVIFADPPKNLRLGKADSWSFGEKEGHNRLVLANDVSDPMISAMLVGRDYTLDPAVEDRI